MGKNKLRKFAEMRAMDCVHQYPFAVLSEQPDGQCPLKGHWRQDGFPHSYGTTAPLTLELGCGRGEYTVGLAKSQPERLFVGVDIKGARMWAGARQASDNTLTNAAFLRTSIELLDRCFAPSEVNEIWITFPDPQMKKQRHRLTSARFLDLYRSFVSDGAVVKLKTDSPFLYQYTRRLLQENRMEILTDIPDLHGSSQVAGLREAELTALRSIRTAYEQQWLSRGLTIKYLAFRLPSSSTEIHEVPDDEIPRDTYRSFSRGHTQKELKE